jgi:glycine/sarcosine N-methyltransferase
MPFYTTLAHHYSSIFPLTSAHTSLFNHVIPKKLKTGLDVGCATGLLTEALSKQGLFMMGIDLSETMIELARPLENNQLKFMVGDMSKLLEMFSPSSFDVITCLGNTLVHVPQNTVKDIINDFHACLNPDGILILQIVNYDMIFNEKKTNLPMIDNDFITFIRSYEFPDNMHQLIFKAELIDKKTQTHEFDDTTLYPLFYDSLSSWISENFLIMHTYGSWMMNPYDKHSSPSLIIVAQKK